LWRGPVVPFLILCTSFAATACAEYPVHATIGGKALACQRSDTLSERLLPAPEEASQQIKRVAPYLGVCAKYARLPNDLIVVVRFEVQGQTGLVSGLRVLRSPAAYRTGRFQSCIADAFSGVCFAPFKSPSAVLEFPFQVRFY